MNAIRSGRVTLCCARSSTASRRARRRRALACGRGREPRVSRDARSAAARDRPVVVRADGLRGLRRGTEPCPVGRAFDSGIAIEEGSLILPAASGCRVDGDHRRRRPHHGGRQAPAPGRPGPDADGRGRVRIRSLGRSRVDTADGVSAAPGSTSARASSCAISSPSAAVSSPSSTSPRRSGRTRGSLGQHRAPPRARLARAPRARAAAPASADVITSARGGYALDSTPSSSTPTRSSTRRTAR